MNKLMLMVGILHIACAFPTSEVITTETADTDALSSTTLPTALKVHLRSSGARHLPISSAIVDPEDIMFFLTETSPKTKKDVSDVKKDDGIESKQGASHDLLNKDEEKKNTEEMHTAAAVAYRPLFVYRQQQAQKRKYQAGRPTNSYNYPQYSSPQYSSPQYSSPQYSPGNKGYYIYVPQSGQYIHVPHGYPPVPAGHPSIPYQAPYLGSPSNFL